MLVTIFFFLRVIDFIELFKMISTCFNSFKYLLDEQTVVWNCFRFIWREDTSELLIGPIGHSHAFFIAIQKKLPDKSKQKYIMLRYFLHNFLPLLGRPFPTVHPAFWTTKQHL